MKKKQARKKATYVGAPACFALELALQPVCEAFGAYRNGVGCYLVGSALERPDYRDIDVRMMFPDDVFAKLFPDAGDHWENDPRWLLMTTAISELLRKQTGLPVDFQFQPMTLTNQRHQGPRNAVGVRFAKPVQSSGGERP